jgi:hypothetical protein
MQIMVQMAFFLFCFKTFELSQLSRVAFLDQVPVFFEDHFPDHSSPEVEPYKTYKAPMALAFVFISGRYPHKGSSKTFSLDASSSSIINQAIFLYSMSGRSWLVFITAIAS